MSISNRKDFWSGILFAALGIFFIVFAQEQPLGSASRMGPAYFPSVLGIIMAAVGTVVAVIAFFKKPENLDDAHIERFHWDVLLLILGAVFVFSLMLTHCGLMLSLAAMILIAGFADQEFKIKETIAIIVILDALSYITFVYGVGMLVPVWPDFI